MPHTTDMYLVLKNPSTWSTLKKNDILTVLKDIQESLSYPDKPIAINLFKPTVDFFLFCHHNISKQTIDMSEYLKNLLPSIANKIYSFTKFDVATTEIFSNYLELFDVVTGYEIYTPQLAEIVQKIMASNINSSAKNALIIKFIGLINKAILYPDAYEAHRKNLFQAISTLITACDKSKDCTNQVKTGLDSALQALNITSDLPPIQVSTTDLSIATKNITTLPSITPISYSTENITTGNATVYYPPEAIPFTKTLVSPLLTSKFPAAIEAGTIVGCLELPADILLHIAIRKGCPELTLNRIRFVLTLTTSFAKATLPLFYSMILDDLNDINSDPLTISQKITSTTTIFLLNVLLQGTTYYSQTRLSKDSILRFAMNLLPLLAVIGMVVNVEDGLEKALENIQEGLLLVAGSFLGAAIPKTLVHSFISFFNPADSKKNNTNRSIELAPSDNPSSSLSNFSSNTTPRNSNGSSSGSDSSSLPDPTKFCYFIEPIQFTALKDSFNTLIIVLGYIAEDYTESILNISKANERNNDPSLTANVKMMKEKREGIINEQAKLISMQLCLNENKHRDACKLFETAYDMLKDESVTPLHGAFNFLKRTLQEETIRNLNRIKGYNQDNALLLSQDDETLRNASLPTKLEFVVQIAQQLNATIQGVFTNYDKKEAGCNQKNSPTQLFRQVSHRQSLPAVTLLQNNFLR
ncbi:MAG: hypothetical protein V4471_07220 [Pseudomonadota bacterium]